MAESDDLTEPREDDLPDKPAPPEVDTEGIADLEDEPVPEDDFLTAEQAREDPTCDYAEDDGGPNAGEGEGEAVPA